MSSLEYFYIELANRAGIYAPGDVVTGSMHYKVNKRFKIKQVIVAAIGEAYVRWYDIVIFTAEVSIRR